jgi:hypothetical protein
MDITSVFSHAAPERGASSGRESAAVMSEAGNLGSTGHCRCNSMPMLIGKIETQLANVDCPFTYSGSKQVYRMGQHGSEIAVFQAFSFGNTIAYELAWHFDFLYFLRFFPVLFMRSSLPIFLLLHCQQFLILLPGTHLSH